MKKIIALTISIIVVVGLVLFTLNKIGVFKETSSKIFSNEARTIDYEKPEINEDHTFIKGYSKTYELNNINLDILAYYYYDEVDNSEYETNEETGEETEITNSTSYFLIRELYINGEKLGETAKVEYSSSNDLEESANNDFNNIKYDTLKDKDNDEEYLVLRLTDNILITGIENIKTSAAYIINKDYEIIKELQNGNSTGFVNIPIYKDELQDRSYLNGINTFNKMYDTNYDYLLYSENGYVDVTKKKIYYIDVNASKCEVDEYQIEISNGEILESYTKTYPDVSEYVTGEGYC